MKKIILLALTALMMVGCDYTPTNHITSDGKRVVLIDSCEYVKWSNGWGGTLYSQRQLPILCRAQKARN